MHTFINIKGKHGRMNHDFSTKLFLFNFETLPDHWLTLLLSITIEKSEKL